MRGGTNSRGYTIVEVMIFVAISGFMFLLAAGFITNKQSTVEFKQGMNTLRTDMAQILDNVSDGYFPAGVNMTCTAGGGTGNPAPTITATTAAASNVQGTNQGCVFMGKYLTLGALSYTVNTVAGRQEYTDPSTGRRGAPVNFAQANPVVAAPMREQRNYPYGMRLVRIISPSGTLRSFGFFSPFGNYQSASPDALYQSGSGILAVASTVDTFCNAGCDSRIVRSPNITLCFDSGDSQYATLTIGGRSGSAQRLATYMRIFNTQAEANAAIGC
jgi:hypothetical protein